MPDKWSIRAKKNEFHLIKHPTEHFEHVRLDRSVLAYLLYIYTKPLR